MPEVKGWLYLKVQEKPKSGKDSVGAIRESPLLFISIPKKIVRLATQRNKIKRLIREAFRQEDRLGSGKTYVFRVTRHPERLSLKEVKGMMRQLILSLVS